ncbi:NAD(P)-dependent oxidoreductase [Bosea sp. (in: a-proteobacteria)]|uniref:NAD(P)-dependent oxidoreductase n=1 Tax=Bosea sp. (in: a-proteobacteria) TaxID=1871050 RepID=UPI003F7B5F94
MSLTLLFKESFPTYIERLSRDFVVHEAPDGLARLPGNIASAIDVLITSGSAGATRADISALPKLRLICTVGTGYEGIDLAACRERGILVTHAAGLNAPVVADHAFGLLIAVVRDIPRADAVARAGGWRAGLTSRPMLGGKHIGIVGLGGVGQAVGRRAAGFDMTVSYFARGPKDAPGWNWIGSVEDLAAHVDFLVCTLPGDASTFHMIGTEVLDALGPEGFFVNVGRGSTVDTQALVAALQGGRIAGAGLDVFENEPGVPESLRTLPTVVLTPHTAGGAPEVNLRSADLIVRNLRGWQDGSGLVTLIPEMREAGAAQRR